MADPEDAPMPLWKRLVAAGLVVGGIALFLYMLSTSVETGLP